ncbi:unnamed protein product [Lymnaea stagnalis]|uniref:THD domain-containing protein n=1 Tax=Lymnaea stagnalis TaxID=6523 RepID=A0AAV2IA47_LYMST
MSSKSSILEPVYVSLADDRSSTSVAYSSSSREQSSRTKHHRKVVPQQQPFACIDCSKLMKNPYDSFEADPLMDALTKVYKDGVEKCCAYDNQQLSALLEMSMRRQEVKQVPLPAFNVSDFTFSPASAHKRLYPPYMPANGQRRLMPEFNKTVYVLFKTNTSKPDPLIEHDRGVEVLADGLRIMFSGLYYVYSSIHFRPDSVYPCKDFQYQTWSHFVEKISPNNPSQTGCLLKTAHTCCDECTLDDETSYTGGVFRLEAGDILRVVISGHGLVFFKQQTSFAGLMMLGTANPQNN